MSFSGSHEENCVISPRFERWGNTLDALVHGIVLDCILCGNRSRVERD